MLYNGFMELKEIFDFFKANSAKLATFFVFGLFLGLVIYGILPSKYISSGTLFVGRAVSDSEDFYAYSGFYDQQTALSFTRTVKGLLEDKNLYAEVLTELKEDVTEKNLRDLRKKIKVKNSGAQTLSVEIRANSMEETKTIWNTLIRKTTETVELANSKSNEKLFIQKLNSEVWSRKITHYPLIFGSIGGLFFMGIGTFLIGLKTYFSKNLEEIK